MGPAVANHLPGASPRVPGAGGLLGVTLSLSSQTAKLPFGVTHLAFLGCEGTARPLYPPKTAPVPQRGAAASVQQHEPPRLVPGPLPAEGRSCTPFLLAPAKPGRASASLARQHPGLPGATGGVCCPPSRHRTPAPSPGAEFAAKVPIFHRHWRKKPMSSKGTSPQRHPPPRRGVILMPAM